MKKDFINLDNINKEDLKKILNFGISSKENYLNNIENNLNRNSR